MNHFKAVNTDFWLPVVCNPMKNYCCLCCLIFLFYAGKQVCDVMLICAIVCAYVSVSMYNSFYGQWFTLWTEDILYRV